MDSCYGYDWCVQSLLAVNVSAMINFLPQLLSQLFHLLTRTSSDDVAMNAVRQVVVHQMVLTCVQLYNDALYLCYQRSMNGKKLWMDLGDSFMIDGLWDEVMKFWATHIHGAGFS